MFLSCFLLCSFFVLCSLFFVFVVICYLLFVCCLLFVVCCLLFGVCLLSLLSKRYLSRGARGAMGEGINALLDAFDTTDEVQIVEIVKHHPAVAQDEQTIQRGANLHGHHAVLPVMPAVAVRDVDVRYFIDFENHVAPKPDRRCRQHVLCIMMSNA